MGGGGKKSQQRHISFGMSAIKRGRLRRGRMARGRLRRGRMARGRLRRGT